MFNSIFFNSYGTNIYNTLGALTSLKKELENVIIYNSVGSSSLIVFLKILGYNYEQMFEILRDSNICESLVNGYSVMVQDEEEKKDIIKEFLNSQISKNKLIKNNITLQEIYKLTNIFPCFLLWDKLQESVVNVNPKINPDFRLIDCILASLTGIGTYLDFSIEDNIYSNLSCIDPYPYSKSFNLPIKTQTLYIFNNTVFGFENLSLNFGPLKDIENEILKQQFSRNKIKLSHLKEIMKSDNFLIINSEITREKLESIKISGLFNNGKFQGESFKIGEDTKIGVQKQLDLILNQD